MNEISITVPSPTAGKFYRLEVTDTPLLWVIRRSRELARLRIGEIPQ